MAADRRPYSSEDQDSFSHIDDELRTEEPVEDAILEAEDYRAADSYGTTPAEEHRGVPIEEYLAAERPETPGAVPDEWPEGPDPRSGALHDAGARSAEEAGGRAADLGEIHVTEDDRARAEGLRETWEEGPPEDPRDDEALDEDRDQEPGPDDWR